MNTTKTSKAQYVAIYARTSKDDRNDKKVSTDQQIFDCTELAISSGYKKEQIRVYIDLDATAKRPPKQWLEDGKKKYRPEFTRLLEDVAAGEICCIVARERDRLSRILTMTVKLWDYLDKHGIEDIFFTHESLKQPGKNDASGRFALNMLMAVAQYQLEQTQARILANKKYSKSHNLKICMACYGYMDNKEKQTNEVNPETAPFVKRIYKEYLEGISATQIAENINDDGARGRYGKKFTATLILRILRSKNYIGKGVNSYPEAIIDDNTWIQTQALLKANVGNTYGIKREFNLFAGMVKCGWTNESMIYQKRKTNLNNTYRCNHPRRNKELKEQCQGTYNVSFEQLEKIISKHIAVSKRVKTNKPQDIELHLRKAAIEQNIADLKEANRKGFLKLSDFIEMLKGSNQELAKIEKEILLSIKHIESSKQWNEMTLQEKREQLTILIDNVMVYNDGIIINVKPDIILTTADDITSDAMILSDKENSSAVWFPIVRNKTFKGARKDFADYTGKFYGYEWITAHGIEAMTLTTIE